MRRHEAFLLAVAVAVAALFLCEAIYAVAAAIYALVVAFGR